MEDFLAIPKYYSSLELQNTLINNMLSGVMATPNVLRGIYSYPNVDGCTFKSFNNMHTVKDENGEEVKVENKYYVFEDSDNEGTVTFNFEAAQDGDIYMHIPGCLFADAIDMCKVYVNDVKLDGNVNAADYFTNETWTSVNIGTFAKGDQVTVRLEFSGGKLYLSMESPYYFYYIDYAKLNTAFDQLMESSMYIEEYGNDYVKGWIDLPRGQELIFTTIPYDEGWKVYIDGEQVETVMVLDSLLAIPATEGGHEIEFVYRPDCAVYGGIISVIGILAFALLVIWSRARRVRALAKCTGDKTQHFFYYAGDVKGEWLTEAAEVAEVSEETSDETERNAPSEEKTTEENCENETESEA